MGKRLIISNFSVACKKSVDFYRIKSSYELHLTNIENVGYTEFEVPLILLFNYLKMHVIYIINSVLREFV